MLRRVMSSNILTQVPPLSLIGPRNPSLMEDLFPSISTVQRVAVSLALVGLLVGLGRATFYLPGNPIPISYQTVGVLLIGGILGLRWSLFAILTYYLLGMAGVPVFKDGGNGWHYVSATVTAGYIIGFVAAAPVVGIPDGAWLEPEACAVAHASGQLHRVRTGVAVAPLLRLRLASRGELFTQGMYPFIPGDLVKLIFASVAVGGLWTLADWRRDAKEKR